MVNQNINQNKMEKEFVPYELAVKLKELGFDEDCFGIYLMKEFRYSSPPMTLENTTEGIELLAPTFLQAINFLYICSNKQIDIELKASDTYEERLRKIDQGCEDLWNLQNSKSN